MLLDYSKTQKNQRILSEHTRVFSYTCVLLQSHAFTPPLQAEGPRNQPTDNLGMNPIKLYKPSQTEHYCITDMVSEAILEKFGLEVVDTPEKADVIIASWLKELSPYIQHFGNGKRFLQWNPEPLWMAFEKSVSFNPVMYVMAEQYGQTVPVHIVSPATGDLFTDNYFFLRSTPEEVEDTLNDKAVFDGSNRKVAAVMTYRNSPQFSYKFSDSFYSINNERCRLALDGMMQGMVDIYGRDWPHGFSKEDSRNEHTARKPAILKPYHFNLCSENTIAPGYVTEKIWESVANGCLPIYHAGKEHAVYKDFAPNSFIDTALIDDNSQLWAYINSITPREYYKRFQLCYDALVTAMERTRGEYYRGTLGCLRNRLEMALDWNSGHMRKRLKYVSLPTPDWPNILAKKNPVILDIGANDGGTSFVFHQTFPEAQIFSFEPDKRALERFKNRLISNPPFAQHCRVFTDAVSDTDGELTFYASGGRNPESNFHEGEWDLSGSICKPKEHLKDNPWCTFDKKITIESCRLDSWSQQFANGLIDLIWADVQGAEGKLIEGGRETLSRTRFFYTEYYNHEVFEGQLNLQQILELLPDFEVLADYGSDVLLMNKRLT